MTPSRLALAGMVAGLAIALSACSGEQPTTPISRAKFEAEGKVWPLTVDAAEAGCSGLQEWVMLPDGTKYGLNGFADARHGYADIGPIWKAGKDTPKAWLGDIMEPAKSHCVK